MFESSGDKNKRGSPLELVVERVGFGSSVSVVAADNPPSFVVVGEHPIAFAFAFAFALAFVEEVGSPEDYN